MSSAFASAVRRSAVPTFLLLVALGLLLPALPAAAAPAVAHVPSAGVAPTGVAPVRPFASCGGAAACSDTWVTTTDASTANNVAMNFTVHNTLAIALTAGETLNLTDQELVSYVAALPPTLNFAGVGFYASVQSGKTVINPQAIIPRGPASTHTMENVTDAAITLTNPGTWYFRMVESHGWWWTFTVNNMPIGSGSPAWQNGTYLLNSSTADGYESFAGYTISPYVSIVEAGPSVPFASGQIASVLNPAIVVNSSATTQVFPSNGVYTPIGTGTVPLAGETQVPALPDDYLEVDPASGGTTTAKTTVWGPPPPPPPPPNKAWFGGYTKDASYTNVSGLEVSLSPIPSILPPSGQTYLQEIVVPLNGTTTVTLGLADINVTIGIPIQGFFPFYIVRSATSIDADLYETAVTGSTATISLVNTNGWWWQPELGGHALTSGWIGGSANGSVDLNTSVAWADNGRPFAANPVGGLSLMGFSIPVVNTTQPMILFFGNATAYNTTSSIQLQKTQGGSWGVPFEGIYWDWNIGFCQDLILGASQAPWLPAGTILSVDKAANGRTPPSGNGTSTLWVGLTLAGTATPSTVAAGGTSLLTVTVTSNAVPVTTATVTGQDAAGGSVSVFTFASGAYTATYTCPLSISVNTWDNVTVSVSATGYSSATLKIPLLLTPALVVSDNIQGHGTSVTVTPGTSLVINVWTNLSSTPAVPVGGAWPSVVGSPASLGTMGTNASSVVGYYQVQFQIALTAPSSGQITVAAVPDWGTGLAVASGASLSVTVTLPTLLLGPIGIAVSSGSATDVAPGATISFTVDASEPGGFAFLAGALVTFTVSPAWAGSTPANPVTTNWAGVAYWNLTAPSTLTAWAHFNISATATASGYKGGSTGSVPFSVAPPSSGTTTPTSSNNANAGLLGNPYLLLGIVGIVVVAVVAIALVMMKRKKKGGPENTPQAWGGPAPQGSEGMMMDGSSPPES